MPDFTDEIDFSNPTPLAPMPPATPDTQGEIEYPAEDTATAPAPSFDLADNADALRTAIATSATETATPGPVTRRLWGRSTPQQRTEALQDATAAADTKRTLIAGLVRAAEGIVVGPGRASFGCDVPASKFRETLTLGGFGHLAPRLKSNRAQFGEVMRGLNRDGLRAFAVTRKDVQDAGQAWPANAVARWVVGQLNGDIAIGVGTLGDKVLAADLLKATDADGRLTYEIDFVGGSEGLREKVRREFETKVSEATYTTTDLLNWYRRILADEFHSVEYGSFLYIPGDDTTTSLVYSLTACVKPLMGRTVAIGKVISDDTLMRGLGEALADEVREIYEAYNICVANAQTREVNKAKRNPDATQAEIDLAKARAVVLPGAASGIVRKLVDIEARIDGFSVMLGSDAVVLAKGLVSALRQQVAPLCDDTSARFAALDMD